MIRIKFKIGFAISAAMMLVFGLFYLNPERAMAAPIKAPSTQTSPVPPTITVKKELLPATDPGRFDLSINETVVAPNVGDGGTSGGILVGVGSYEVRETAVSGSLQADYDTVIRCVDQANQLVGSISGASALTVQAVMGQEITCTFTNVRKNALTLTKTDFDVSREPGETVAYALGYANSGSVDLTGVVISEIVPANTTFDPSGSSSGWSCDFDNNSGSTCTFAVGSLAAGATNSERITFAVTIDDPITAANVTSINNFAQISDDSGQHVAIASDATPLINTHSLIATKQDSIVNDANGDNVAGPGDTVAYQVELENNGNAPISAIVLNDTPDQYTTLVAGTINTTAGTVINGDSAGDTDVQVDIGTIAVGGSVMINYEVIIDAGIPMTITQLQNQALVTSNELPALSTDDPDTLTPNDATITSLSLVPVIVASQSDTLQVDSDGNDIPSPGDTILMETVISNIGNGGATNVLYTALSDPNVQIVPGSVTTTLGSINVGNSAGDRQVDVLIPFLPRNSAVTIRYEILINDPLPANVLEIKEQGVIKSDQLPDVLTDDLALPASQDPTSVSISAVAAMSMTKRDLLFIDSNSDNLASAGDILFYKLSIVNNGNAGSVHLFFEDEPDSHTTLLIGSVKTSQGTILTGNAIGDSSIEIDLGSVTGSGSVILITYQVKINSVVPVDQLATQAKLTSSDTTVQGFFLLSDDPDTAPIGDVTITSVKFEAGISSTYLPIIEVQQAATISN